MYESDAPLLSLLGVLQKHQAGNCNMYTEDLEQAHAGSVIASSVSVSYGRLFSAEGMSPS